MRAAHLGKTRGKYNISPEMKQKMHEERIGRAISESTRAKHKAAYAKFGDHHPCKLGAVKGENHPRWNPNKTEFRKYCNRVNSITRKQDISTLDNFHKPRGLCGQAGAYQLDHIVSIKLGYENNIPAEEIGDISNLQFLPWKENRLKGHI